MAGKLTVAEVRNAKPGQNAAGGPAKRVLVDGAGLLLVVAPSGARNWILRVQDGKDAKGKPRRRDIGLGAVDDGAGRRAFGNGDDRASALPIMLRRSLTLAEAREKAAALRRLVKAGVDPLVERDKARRVVPTFAEAVTAAHEGLARGWADRTAKAFLASLVEHANPKLGAMKVDAIGASEIILALAPIWHDKPVIARKVRARILQVLAFAKARGWRADALPDARELRGGLAKQARGDNFAAMPFIEVPDFVGAQLGKEMGASRAALLFAILTAARSGEVRNAVWDQIDINGRTWTRPADMMKMGAAHVVTLSDAAIAVLDRLAPNEALRAGLVFPGAKANRPLSDMSLTKIMRLADRTETVHGFRSAFRDFAAERCPTIPAMVAEMALAHRVGTATEQAYLRSDLRDMRRALMDAWGRFVAPSLSGAAGNVVELAQVVR
ncbi:UNVERIFIED_ORG: integrase [Sphingomonas sp. R1F5B]